MKVYDITGKLIGKAEDWNGPPNRVKVNGQILEVVSVNLGVNKLKAKEVSCDCMRCTNGLPGCNRR